MDVCHLRELHGLPAYDLPKAVTGRDLPAAGSVAWRLSLSGQWGRDMETFEQLWDRFGACVDPAGVRALIIGEWNFGDDSAAVVRLLAEARERYTGLEALFLGDMIEEENSISFILHTDVTPLLESYPGLVELGVRGGTGLTLRPVRHAALRRLRLESGGLPAAVVRAVGASDLPALERLELWLGVRDYGGDATVDDLAALLTGERLPALRHLGLQNSEIQDEIAAAVATAPVVAHLHSLSLAMGTLGDEGAEALLTGQPLTHLHHLDLHHHFLTPPTAQRLRDALEPAGVRLDLRHDTVGPVAHWYGRYAQVTE